MKIYLCRTHDWDGSDLIWGAFTSLDFLKEFSDVKQHTDGSHIIKIAGKSGGYIDVEVVELDSDLDALKQRIKEFWMADKL